MAENYKHLYEQTKKLLAMYQDELVPGFRKRIEELEAKHKWIPVSERLPDIELVEVRAEEMDLFPCLVVKSAPQSYKKRFVTKAWYDGKGFMDTDCIWITKSVTHWMPLPEPPKEESE